MNVCVSTTTIIELGRLTDAPACGNILADWVDENLWIPQMHSRAECRAHLVDLIGRGWVLIARRCGQPIGFLAHDGGEIHALYLARPVRGKGVGQALLDTAKSRVNALALWTFQANHGARNFYLRQGFHEVRRSDGTGNDEGLPDIRYEWSNAHG